MSGNVLKSGLGSGLDPGQGLGVMLDAVSLDQDDIDFSALRDCLPRWDWHSATGPEQLAARIHNASVIISNKVYLGAQTLAQAPKLKLICIAATGTNNVDLAAAARHNITVCNVTRYATPSVVQHVFAMILCLSRNLMAYRDRVHAGDWQRSPQFCLLSYPIRELQGLTLGIIGYGELGRAVTQMASHFGMKVLLATRTKIANGTTNKLVNLDAPDRFPLEQLLPQVDILSLHCPLTEDNHHLIGAGELALMKPDALLINTARGGLVDEAALLEALQTGRIGGAGIDVIAEEPPLHGNPLLETRLTNLLVTPHIAWASLESRQRLVDQMVANINAFLAGKPQNLVG